MESELEQISCLLIGIQEVMILIWNKFYEGSFYPEIYQVLIL